MSSKVWEVHCTLSTVKKESLSILVGPNYPSGQELIAFLEYLLLLTNLVSMAGCLNERSVFKEEIIIG